MYFEKLMHMASNTHLEINTNIMHQSVVAPTTFKIMLHVLSNELDRGAISVYSDAMKARVRFQQDVTIERTDPITNDQAWHQFTTIDHHKDVK